MQRLSKRSSSVMLVRMFTASVVSAAQAIIMMIQKIITSEWWITRFLKLFCFSSLIRRAHISALFKVSTPECIPHTSQQPHAMISNMLGRALIYTFVVQLAGHLKWNRQILEGVQFPWANGSWEIFCTMFGGPLQQQFALANQQLSIVSENYG